MNKINLILFLFLFLLNNGNSIAGFFDNDVKVKFQFCKDHDNPKLGYQEELFGVYTYVVNKDKQEVIRKEEFFENGKLIGNDLRKLNACTVIDKLNWRCGGELIGNLSHSTQSVVNGKFSFFKGTFLPNYCAKFTQY